MSSELIGTVEKHGSRLDIVTSERLPVGPGFLMMFRMQLGQLQDGDIGKRVYFDRSERQFTMENNEERDARKPKPAQ